MEGKKMAPPTQQQQQQLLLRQQQQQQLPPAEPQYSQPPRYPQHIQAQPNGVIHQPPVRAHHPQAISPRSPLLENHQDLYGTRQQTELSRQYAIREQNMQIAAQRAEQQRNIPMVNSSYSLQSPTRDPILSAPVPPGYNASVHQAYLRRNQHQLNIPDQQQIYQNHQSLYQPANVQPQQQQPRLYQPYTSRIKQTSPGYLSPGHSYTQLLRQNYNELQQMKLQQQMQYQSQAQLQQQQTFAQRQILHQHLHSRQQSQQNLNQYGTTKQTTTAQLNEVNSRLQKSEQNDYAMQPYQNSKQQLRQNQSQSPLVHMPTSPGSKEPLSSPSTKSPSSSESRRSSSGTGQALRSPIAQRPLSAPVTKAGWLYKQGSDGLKVWRKRWFVLSEYCLFYYKGQEEDKLLGSVLLPSYKVSLCTADDKVMRKFAFKCEHANMRTYVLAAHDQDLMNQWVHVLTMAALMQEGSSGEKSQQYSTGLNIPNSERRSKTPVNMDQDDITPEISGAIQPMYENAPPKPRRSNEGYNSPSPEKSMERYDPNYDILREPSYKHGENPQARSQNNRLGSKSPLPGSPDVVYDSKTGATTGNYVMQRNLTKSPEGVYNSHNLSLPLTNTHNNRLENNKSPLNYQDASNLSSTNSRLDQNKSPAYFDSRNLRQDPQRQNYPVENQNVYNEMNNRMTEQYAQEIQNQQAYQQNTPSQAPSERQAFERRTPDTYGRSAIVPGYYSKGRAGDYEDVYHQPQGGNAEGLYGEQSYRRPQSPISYEDDKLTPNTLQQQIYGQANIDNGKMYQAPPVQVRQKKKPNNYSAPVLPQNVVPRPHSADFLEYEAKNSSYNPKSSSLYSSQASRQPPRPKSSLDINTYNDYNGDSYYYSEASYAEKMRQSAHYLRNKNFGNPRALGPLSPVEFSSQRKLSMPIFRGNETNESSYESDMRTDGEPLYGGRDQNRNVSGNGSKYSEITGPNSNWTLRNKSLSHIMGQEELYNRSNSAMSEGSSVSGALGGEQFTRSASARLPSTSTDHLPYREGEKKVQQREESMKRLLEWKQRMLQSPLTRKTTPTTLSLARSLHHARSPAAAATTAGHTFPKSSSRLPAHLQHNNYNSYSSDDEASVSVSGVGMDGVSRSAGKKPLAGSASTTPIPVRAVSPRVRVAAEQAYNGHHQDTWPMHNLSQTLSAEDSWSVSRSPSRQASSHQPVRAVSPRVRRASDIDERNVSTLWEPMMNVSAGELLGRSHEELVLLLIQLRRRRAATGQAMEQCWAQIQSVQSRICAEELMDQRHEDMQRLEQLRQHLAELERHYEKSKPLVHLVDNMVKLGTLYNRGNGVGDGGTLERLEMNQINRERQLAEEKRWAMSAEMLSREQVEQKVEQLRAMERCVAGEAGALRGLRREREALQRALGGAHLQQDLSRVHHMLAINSKKLEQTVAGNARLEQELSVLRHKLQQQGQQPGAGPHTPDTSAADTTAMLEDELKRVQQLVGDLQKQRQELSVAVRQLTDKSQGLGLMSPPLSTLMSNSSTDLAGSAGKKRNHSTWTETDLDSNNLHDESSTNSGRGLLPLYIDTHSTQGASSPSPSDEPSQNSAFSNLTNVEKQEIKTVRIVKRESERRQRDRERSLQPGNPDWSAQNSVSALDQLLEEDFQHSRSTSLPRGYQSNPPQALTHNNSSAYQAQALPTTYMYQKDNNLSAYSQKSHANPPNTLSLTNVNIPFDNMSISSISSSNRYISSPSLVNNNDYLGNHEMHNGPSHRYAGYQNHSSNQILPLPTSYSISKHSSAPYLESPEEYKRPVVNGPSSKVVSASSLSKGTAELSPVFTSEAARQIIIEMSGEKSVGARGDGSQHRRQVPREKRRHYTAPHHLSAKSLLATDNEDDIFLQEWCRARDDVDMERVLRGRAARGPPPLVAPPDLVRSTLPPPTQPEHYSEHTIDRLLAAPNKILIPERYIPEQAPELSPEEQQKRREKVESIKKMLSNSTPSGDPSKSPDGEDKRQREHLLQLNQILAKQVMEMSKIVAEKALKTLPADGESSGESDLSPDVELPLYQQRDNFFT